MREVRGKADACVTSTATAPIQKIIQKKSKRGIAWEACVITHVCVYSQLVELRHNELSSFHRDRFSSGMLSLFKEHYIWVSFLFSLFFFYPGRLWLAQPGGQSRMTPMKASPWVWRESTSAAGRRRCGVSMWSWCRDDCTSLKTQQETFSECKTVRAFLT